MDREAINASISRRYIILDKSGREYEISDPGQCSEITDRYPILGKFVNHENGQAASCEQPKSIKAMQRLELADYEPASDSGHFRFYPKGALIFELIKDWADEIAMNRLKAVKIETPLLYSYDEPDIRQQVESFHERHYMAGSSAGDKDFILRFAADFGLFRMMKDAVISYRNLPLRVYEFSKSFRYEKSGELAGLRRLRGFSMPDIHSFTAGIEEGFNEYKEIFKNYNDLAEAMGIRFVTAFRVVESFYGLHKQELVELAAYSGMPVYIELLSDMKHYWAVKSELQAMDCGGGFVQLSTVQLDVKDADIYGIRYVDSSGGKKGCTICHSSIGSVERWIYSILETALMRDKPELPYWLSPAQVRLVPVSDEYNGYCGELLRKLQAGRVRVEVDDTGERVGKKVRNAAKDWVPYVIAIGSKEVETGKLGMKKRDGSEMDGISIEEVIKRLKAEQGDMPFRTFNLNPFISRRPVFRG